LDRLGKARQKLRHTNAGGGTLSEDTKGEAERKKRNTANLEVTYRGVLHGGGIKTGTSKEGSDRSWKKKKPPKVSMKGGKVFTGGGETNKKPITHLNKNVSQKKNNQFRSFQTEEMANS